MGIPVIIYGKSGSGKSRSLKNFKEDEIYLTKVINKPLPFKNNFKYVTNGDQLEYIKAGLTKMAEKGIKTAVVDDFGYIMTNKFMRGHSNDSKGNAVFALYNQIADDVWSFIAYVQSEGVAPDAIVYLIMHEDDAEDGTSKLRTIGKLLDQKVCIEGMCTVVLHSAVKGGRHVFETQSTFGSVAKSPEGMFDDVEIDNDLKMVDDKIREYWGLK